MSIILRALLCLVPAARASNGTSRLALLFSRWPLPAVVLCLGAGVMGRYSSTARSTVTDCEHHGQEILRMALAPDAERLAGGSEGILKVWNTVDGRAGLTLREEAESAIALAFSPDGDRLATAGLDQRVRIRTMPEGQVERTLPGSGATISALAFSADGRTLAAGSVDGSCQLWELASGKAVTNIHVHQWVCMLLFTPDGKTLAIGGLNGTLELWDVPTRSLRATIVMGNGRVSALAASRDSRMLAVGNGSGGLYLVDVAEGRAVMSIKAHEGPVLALAFAPDGTRVFTGGTDETIRAWDSPSARRAGEWPVGHHWILALACQNTDHALLAAGSWNRSVKVWRNPRAW